MKTFVITLILFCREILELSDGGEVALDWAIECEDSPSLEDNENTEKPVLLILPGITGCSAHNYIKYLVRDGLMEGYRPVVFNQRGNGGIPLKVRRGHFLRSKKHEPNLMVFGM